MTSGISSSDPGLISSRLEENLLQIKEEGNHARWRGWTSNPLNRCFGALLYVPMPLFSPFGRLTP